MQHSTLWRRNVYIALPAAGVGRHGNVDRHLPRCSYSAACGCQYCADNARVRCSSDRADTCIAVGLSKTAALSTSRAAASRQLQRSPERLLPQVRHPAAALLPAAAARRPRPRKPPRRLGARNVAARPSSDSGGRTLGGGALRVVGLAHVVQDLLRQLRVARQDDVDLCTMGSWIVSFGFKTKNANYYLACSPGHANLQQSVVCASVGTKQR